MRLQGKTAVVTGGGSGIGRATARALAAEGAWVLVGDIAVDNGEATAAAIRAEGGRADFIRLDVTKLESIAAFKSAADALGAEVDIIANVAGWGRNEPFLQNSPDFWRQVVDLNLMGPIAVSHAFLPGMIERGRGGKIVTVASDAGRVGSLGETVYAGAKGGAIAFAKSLARETARYNITSNCVCPGPTDTALMAAVPDKIKDAFARVTPMRRLGKPEEVAQAIVFFSTDQSSFCTGQVLSVSGGLTMAG